MCVRVCVCVCVCMFICKSVRCVWGVCECICVFCYVLCMCVKIERVMEEESCETEVM